MLHKKEMRTTSNQKYEITEISHEKYPFLHRIRALRDVSAEVRAGDLGGFVESESNLSFEPDDPHGSLTMPLPAMTPMLTRGLFCVERRSSATTLISLWALSFPAMRG